jgi:hypothetical protein
MTWVIIKIDRTGERCAVRGGHLPQMNGPVRVKTRARREMPPERGTFKQAPKADQPGAVQPELGL